MINEQPIGRKNDIVVQELNGETIIYDLTINKAYLLNKTAALVWNSLDGETTVSQINGLLAKRFGRQSSEDLVWLAIDKLHSNNLIVASENIENPLANLSRREAVKRAALTTMIALPVISSLVAPAAANAASVATCPMSVNVCYAAGSQICQAGCNGKTYNYLSCASTNGTCLNCFTNLTSTCGTLPITLINDIIISSFP